MSSSRARSRRRRGQRSGKVNADAPVIALTTQFLAPPPAVLAANRERPYRERPEMRSAIRRGRCEQRQRFGGLLRTLAATEAQLVRANVERRPTLASELAAARREYPDAVEGAVPADRLVYAPGPELQRPTKGARQD